MKAENGSWQKDGLRARRAAARLERALERTGEERAQKERRVFYDMSIIVDAKKRNR